MFDFYCLILTLPQNAKKKHALVTVQFGAFDNSSESKVFFFVAFTTSYSFQSHGKKIINNNVLKTRSIVL